MGSVAGFFLFEICGGAVSEDLSKWEDSLKAWLSPRRAAFLPAACFAVCSTPASADSRRRPALAYGSFFVAVFEQRAASHAY